MAARAAAAQVEDEVEEEDKDKDKEEEDLILGQQGLSKQKRSGSDKKALAGCLARLPAA